MMTGELMLDYPSPPGITDGIDVQYNIVHGNRESIRDEIRTLFANFDARNGNYMASPCNSIMPETPIENVWAMMEAIEEFGTF